MLNVGWQPFCRKLSCKYSGCGPVIGLAMAQALAYCAVTALLVNYAGVDFASVEEEVPNKDNV